MLGLFYISGQALKADSKFQILSRIALLLNTFFLLITTLVTYLTSLVTYLKQFMSTYVYRLIPQMQDPFISPYLSIMEPSYLYITYM